MNNRSVLITGSTGFLGSAFLRRLKDENIRVLRSQGRASKATESDEIDIHSLETEELAEQMEKEKICSVYHFATHFSPSLASSVSDEVIRTNLLFSTRVAEASFKAQVSRFVNIASTWEWMREHNPSSTEPFTPYAASKKAFRDYLGYRFGASNRIQHVVIEESIGTRDTRTKLVPQMIRAGLEKRPFVVRDASVSLNFAEADGLASYLFNQFQKTDSAVDVIGGYADYHQVSIGQIHGTLQSLGLDVKLEISGDRSTNQVSRVNLLELGIPLASSSQLSLSEVLEGSINFLRNADFA